MAFPTRWDHDYKPCDLGSIFLAYQGVTVQTKQPPSSREGQWPRSLHWRKPWKPDGITTVYTLTSKWNPCLTFKGPLSAWPLLCGVPCSLWPLETCCELGRYLEKAFPAGSGCGNGRRLGNLLCGSPAAGDQTSFRAKGLSRTLQNRNFSPAGTKAS
jgi:hypothetical protein